MQFLTLISNIKHYSGVTDDSRDITPGCVFVAGAGRANQAQYLQEALDRGAALVVSETVLTNVDPARTVIVPDRRIASAELAQTFYEYPSNKLLMIGVTGTSGKTTSTYLIEAILTAAGYRVGVIGTENIRYGGKVFHSPNTTPSAFILHRTLREMVADGCTAVVMEVSSHAIAHNRSHGVNFDGAIFTNLTIEHLDLHGDMDSYFATKRRLFTEYAQGAIASGKRFACAINVGNEWGRRLYHELGEKRGPKYAIESFALYADATAEIDGQRLIIDANGIVGQIDDVDVKSVLLGRFNAENILGVVSLARQLGISTTAIEDGIRTMNYVPGRMERVYNHAGVLVVVDYAHKPGALQAVLETLRELCVGRLISVFGCGGLRDRAKRPVMGAISVQFADLSIVTTDNTRGESVRTILDDIQAGIPQKRNGAVIVQPDRREAIRKAVLSARPNDIILIAGRGAEAELIINTADNGTTRVRFDDRVVSSEIAATILGDPSEQVPVADTSVDETQQAEGGVERWFSVPIYRTNVGSEPKLTVLADTLLAMESEAPNDLDYRKGLSNTGWHSPQWTQTTAPDALRWVVDLFLGRLRAFLSAWIDIEVPRQRHQIEALETEIALWSVVNSSGNHNLRHIHTSNVRDTWACVLYVAVPPEADGGHIRFFNPNLAYRCSIGTTLSKLGGEGMYRYIAPARGDLVIFPGWLEHDVTPFTNGTKRIIVAANLGITRLEVRSAVTQRLRRVI